MAKKDQEWRDDKVFQAKVSNGKQFMSNGKSWLDYYYEDQEKRKKEAEQGKVRYAEAAKASRIQYSLPQYQGSSQNQGKTYNWERDLMANTKIKGAGNSYTKKFDALTKSMGMTPGQAEEYRKFMDFQEDSQHVDPKMNKDGTINQSQSLNPARDSHLKVDVIDGILDNMKKTTAAKVQKAKEVPFQKVSGFDKVKNALGMDLTEEQQNTLEAKKLGVEPHFGGKKDKTSPVLKSDWQDLKDTKARENSEKSLEERDGLYGFLDRYVLPISQAADEVLIPGNNEVQVQNEMAKYGDVVNPATKAGMIDRGLETKILHGAGTMAGYLAPYGEGYNAINAALKLPKLGKAAQFVENSPYLGRVAVGGAAGVAAETGLAATNELANSEANAMGDYAQRIALGAVGGAIGDPLLHGAGRALNLKGQLNQVLDGSVPFSEEGFANALKEAYEPKGNPSNVLADPVKADPLHVLEQFTDGWNKKPPVKINNWQDNIAQQADEVPTTPQESVPHEQVAYDEANKAWDMRKSAEDDFVKQEMSPIYEVAQKQAQAQQTWESVVKDAQKQAKRIKDYYGKIVPDGLSKDLINEIPPQFRAARSGNGNDIYKFADEEGFSSADEAIAFLKQIDADSKTKLKELMPEDGYVYKEHEIQALEDAARQRFAESDQGKAVEDVLTKLIDEMQGKNTTRTLENAPTPGIRQTPAEKLKNVNNSQAPEQAITNLIESVAKKNPEKLDELLMSLDGKLKNPKSETEAVKPAQAEGDSVAGAEEPFDPLVRLNAQKFNDDDATNSLYSYNDKSEPDLVSDHMSTPQKIYKALVSSNHDLQVVSNKLVKNNAVEIKTNYENRIQAAKDSGRPEEAKRLAKEYKYLYKKNGGLKGEAPLVQAAQNEQTAYTLTEELIQGTYGQAEKALEKAGINLADAWEYQAAKNLDYHMRMGGHEDYILSKGWDKGRLVDVINKWKGNEAMDQFGAAINEIRKTRLDYLEKSGLKSSEEFALLNKNEHYIPMSKDKDWNKSAIEANLKKVSSVGSAKPNVMALGKGDEGYFANPVESMMSATYTSIRNALRNDTAGQIAKLAQLDKEGIFIRPTDLPATYGGNVIEHYDDGVLQNYVLSPDMAKTIETLRSPEQAAGTMEKVTGFMGSLKTTSIPYQVRAIPRDWTQAIVNLDGNPLSHVYNLAASVLSPKKAMKEAMKEGGAFHNAFKDGMGAHRTTREMAENFMKANRAKGGKDEIVTPKTAKDKSKQIAQKLWKLNFDYHAGEKLGNFGDTAPRLAAMKQVEKEFTPAMKELEDKIASMDPNDAFELPLLKSELNDLKTQFQREKIFKARDVINYSRGGSSFYAKSFKKYWNFANTATQSVDRYFRQLKKNPVSTIAKTMTVAAPMIGAQEMAYHASSDEDKKIYDDTPDFLKNTMYLFVVNGHRVMFPKPFEVAFVTSPIEGALNLSHTYDEESMRKKVQDGVVRSMQELVPLDIGDMLTLNFSGMSLTQPLDEVKNNRKNFNGKPISFYDRFKSSDKKNHFFLEDGVKMEDVAGKYTSPTARKLGELIGANPDYIAHLIGGYGGDTGKNALAALDALIKPSENNKKTVTQNMNPFQDFYNSKKPSYFWRDSYTEKDKDKEKK